jgi:predicted TIM-barrel fold metal-dependent hydrolase
VKETLKRFRTFSRFGFLKHAQSSIVKLQSNKEVLTMIDIHTHVGRIGKDKSDTLHVDELLSRMDEWGVEKAVLLPLGGSPEGGFFYHTNEQVLSLYRRHSDRIIPFCNLDPRFGGNAPTTDFKWLLAEYKELGVRGVGEITANLYIDDPMVINLFRQCGDAGLPVTFHLACKIGGVYGVVDDLGLPRLEKVLKECPDTVFFGHAMSFWSEISADATDETRGGYPDGPVVAPGRLQHLLSEYPNLYGDLSAGSGFNAITRDPDYGVRFLEEFQDKLIFGTDLCHHNQNAPIVEFFLNLRSEGRISNVAYEKITRGNATRLLGLNF